jgi:hypothetical protein
LKRQVRESHDDADPADEITDVSEILDHLALQGCS